MKKLSVIFFIASFSLLLSACAAKPVEATTSPVNAISQSLIAEGRLLPVNSLVHSFSISGQIAEVLVENGEQVKVGQELARLSDTSAAELALENAKAEALLAQQTVDRLASTVDLTLAQAQLNMANAKDEYDRVAWNQFRANQSRETNEDVINAARAAVVLAQDSVDSAQEKFDKYKDREDSDPLKAAALNELSNANIRLDQARVNLNYYLNPPSEQDLAISSAEVALAKAKYEEAQRILDKLQNGLESDELVMARARLSSAQAAVVYAQSQMDAMILKANIAGTVVDLSLQAGQKISAGETAVVIADFSNWIIETDNLTEIDVTSIAVGQTANVELDALPGKSLSGEVTYIDSLFEEKRGDITYTVTILLIETDPLMRWGMTGAVEFLP